jgi:predicted MFS family arabinose efflux permease
VLIVTGTASYWSLIAITLAAGAVNALDSPLRQVYVLDLVGEARVAGAVSLYEVILNLSRVLGPAVGGVLLATSGAAACVLVNALTFVAPLVALLRFRPEQSGRPRQAGAGRPRAWDGVRYAWSRPLLRACVLLAAASGILFASTATLPILATRVFHLGSSGYGVLLGLFGVGALPGALLAARGAPSGARVRMLAVLTAVAMIVAATAPDRPVLFAAMVATGAASIWMIAAANTLVQLRTAPELRGRVMGAWTAALPGTVPVTSLAGGLLTDACGARVAFSASGALIGGIAIACWRAYADG